ncbi:MAG: FHA domain-containing protein [Clostridiales bacterium]|nr:FHA domain-containing protein [Clostridiales bacterium]
MNLTRCASGHFYDSDKYATCPHCSSAGAVASDSVTMPLKPSEDKTMALDFTTASGGGSSATLGGAAVTQSLSKATAAAAADDDQKTISYSAQSLGTEPVVGWLVVSQGPDMGVDFRLKTGRNFIGRSSVMDVSLKNDKTVSREKHGIVVYDPKSCSYIMQPGASKELCYLNDEVVLSPVKLKAYDVITVGETSLLFIPLCSKDGFNWDKNNSDKD